MGRVNVSLKNNIMKAIEDYAERDGRAVSAVIGEAASIYLESRELGVRAEDIIRAFRVLLILKEMDSVPVPPTLLAAMIQSASEASGDKIIKKWREKGTIIGNFLREYAKSLSDFFRFITRYRGQTPANVFNTELEGNVATVIISGAGYSREALKRTAEGLSAFLISYAHRATSTEFSEGFVKNVAIRI
ncbi:MAG: hypothetical protein QXV17_09820 [Candidatus Micrarchaeaceae archaeon]